MNVTDESLITARVPVGPLREAARLPESPLKPVGGKSPDEVSVTQAIRIRRSRRRAPTDFSRRGAQTPVEPWRDAIFPAMVSLALTVPSAAHLWQRDAGAWVGLMPLLGFAVTFGLVALLSRTLDGHAD